MPELSVFQKINDEMYSQLVSICFDSLSQKIQPSEVFSRYKTVCKNSDIEFSDLEPSLKSFLHLCKDALKSGKSAAQMHDDLQNLGMNNEQIEIFVKQWDDVRSSLIHSSTAETIPINPLVDMEWKFGVTSASSQVNSIGNVYLQMKLEVDQGNGRTKSVFFELQLSEFYAFLHEMERARASLDYLS
ncbi:COMM domain-containing protein 7 isoform X2 [Parasteatoda tepidariorum]|uniref:COMM domain-containing protein 7 n=2 Tax=Parasteatoda tepidariorum TaxID=114398 RepID=A0A2L2Y797_PARTP|nr:COMM domain-containing protein 7 isoform X2 [Parasteatoda tepidariorum]